MLLEDFQEFVDYYRPAYIFIENVPGIVKQIDSPLTKFKEFLEEKKYGYDNDVINAKYYGVPQNRRRYVLIATRLHPSISLPKSDENISKTVRNVIGDADQFKYIEAGHNDKTLFIHTAASL